MSGPDLSRMIGRVCQRLRESDPATMFAMLNAYAVSKDTAEWEPWLQAEFDRVVSQM